MQDVLEVLENISNEVSSDPIFEQINAGGCAYFASFIKYHLDYIGVPNKFVYIDDRGSDNARVIKKRIKKDGWRGSASHVVLKVGNKYFDSTGVHNNKKPLSDRWGDYKRIIPFKMSLQEYYEHAIVNKRHDWADWWNYRKNNPKLKKLINKNFESWYKKQNREVTEIKQVAKGLLSLK